MSIKASAPSFGESSKGSPFLGAKSSPHALFRENVTMDLLKGGKSDCRATGCVYSDKIEGQDL